MKKSRAITKATQGSWRPQENPANIFGLSRYWLERNWMHLAYGRASQLIHSWSSLPGHKAACARVWRWQDSMLLFSRVTELKGNWEDETVTCTSVVWNLSYLLYPHVVEVSRIWVCMSSWVLVIYLLTVATYLSGTYKGKIYLGLCFLGQSSLPWKRKHGGWACQWWWKPVVDFSHVRRAGSRECTLELNRSIAFTSLPLMTGFCWPVPSS